MELTREQKAEIERIVAEMDCAEGFHCCESGFDDLTPVQVLSYGPVECLKPKDSYCRMSRRFGLDSVFCTCPLRRHMALTLDKLPEWQRCLKEPARSLNASTAEDHKAPAASDSCRA